MLLDDVALKVDGFEFVTTQMPPAPSRVLEVGCGDGRLARALNDVGHRVVAIDPAAPEGAIFQAASLEEFADRARFDAVVASRSLHHIHDLAGGLAKLQRLLVPGGLELGEELEQEERRLIEAGSIQATGFQYVGEQSGS